MKNEKIVWNGQVFSGSEKDTPKWLSDAILVAHTVWFDSAWNMRVTTKDGVKTCKVGDTIVNGKNGLDVIHHA